MNDNATVIAYVKKQGGLHSRRIHDLSVKILSWAEDSAISLTARYISGKRNIITDGLSSRGQVLPVEWSLHPDVARAVIENWGALCLDLFARRLNAMLPVFCSSVVDPAAALEDAF
ncbi:uncharacterized protein [Palaemon carinicauda]|uniref:uncharacterized protein n=1 Tax=Palaemon carinicauda TaxID=392227 RepID=UPI0035B60EF4